MRLVHPGCQNRYKYGWRGGDFSDLGELSGFRDFGDFGEGRMADCIMPAACIVEVKGEEPSPNPFNANNSGVIPKVAQRPAPFFRGMRDFMVHNSLSFS